MGSVSDVVNSAGDIGAGHVLGRYELLMPIASGGMAMVWAARLRGTRGFQKIVAVKTMLPKLSEDDQFEQMFLDEASLASQIRHPHVVEIMDLGEEDGILYLVMEMVEGVPLNQLMKAAKRADNVPTDIAVRIVMQAAGGLHAAHELRGKDGKLVGLVHRDVSPQNILVTYDGVTKVVDFGIAKATAMGGGATVAGQIKGKVAYMAPEQVRGGDIDRRVDVFALGIVLYALTTGKHPLRRESEAATMYNICSPDPVMPPSKIVQGYPALLERVVLQALAKDPDKRYSSANELLRALDGLPTSMRAGTDEDVGKFVVSLFGDRRDERRHALEHALELADRQATDEQRSLRMPAPVGTLSGLSDVASVAASGSRAALVSPAEIRASLGGSSTFDVGSMDAPLRPTGRRRLLISGGVLGLVVLGGGIVAFAASNGRPETPTASARPAASSEDTPPTPSASPERVTAVDPGSLPVAPADDDEPDAGSGSVTPASTATPRIGPVRPVGKPTSSPTAKPTATGKPPGWNKQDPGF